VCMRSGTLSLLFQGLSWRVAGQALLLSPAHSSGARSVVVATSDCPVNGADVCGHVKGPWSVSTPLAGPWAGRQPSGRPASFLQVLIPDAHLSPPAPSLGPGRSLASLGTGSECSFLFIKYLLTPSVCSAASKVKYCSHEI
jgi:hypothetical protein